MICYIFCNGKQHLGPHVVVGYGIKIFWPGLFITSPDHLVDIGHPSYEQLTPDKTRFPLTSITRPYRGLKFTAHRGHVFL